MRPPSSSRECDPEPVHAAGAAALAEAEGFFMDIMLDDETVQTAA